MTNVYVENGHRRQVTPVQLKALRNARQACEQLVRDAYAEVAFAPDRVGMASFAGALEQVKRLGRLVATESALASLLAELDPPPTPQGTTNGCCQAPEPESAATQAPVTPFPAAPGRPPSPGRSKIVEIELCLDVEGLANQIKQSIERALADVRS